MEPAAKEKGPLLEQNIENIFSVAGMKAERNVRIATYEILL